jgi:hypothetical protein
LCCRFLEISARCNSLQNGDVPAEDPSEKSTAARMSTTLTLGRTRGRPTLEPRDHRFRHTRACSTSGHVLQLAHRQGP